MTESKTIYNDLLEAQKEIEDIEKDGKNPFYKSEYTTLNATILACKEILNKHNIIVIQPINSDENGVYVSTTLIHTSGEKITSKMRIQQVKANDPQAQGSAITYARRYSLKSLLTMSDDDDDGEKAMTTVRLATDSQKKTVARLCRETNTHQDKVWEYLKVPKGTKLSSSQASEVIKWLNTVLDARGEVK